MRSPERDRMVVLDGLRGIAILLVVLSHAVGVPMACVHCPVASPFLFAASGFVGTVGVMLFFTLSGFLLFLPFARAILSPDMAQEGEKRLRWPSTWGFYVRRMRRILPAYYLVLLVVIVFPWLIIAAQTHSSAARLPWGTFLGGVTVIYDLNPVDFTRMYGANAPLWSLTVEWQFYLVLPLLALALRWFAGRGNRKGNAQRRLHRLVAGLVLLMALGLTARGAAAWMHDSLGMTYPAGDTPGLAGLALTLLYGVKGKYLEVFAVGMLASALYVGRSDVVTRFAGRTITLWLAGVGLVLCAVGARASGLFVAGPQTFLWPTNSSLAGWSGAVCAQWVMGLCSGVFLLAALSSTGPGVAAWQRFCAVAPLRGLGHISYSLYLWHFLFLGVVYGPVALAFVPAVGRILLALVLAVVFAYASYCLIERPFLSQRGQHSWRRRRSMRLLKAVA